MAKYTDELKGTDYEDFDMENAPDEMLRLFDIAKGMYEGSTINYKSGTIAEGSNTGSLIYTYTGKDPEVYGSYLENNYQPEELIYGDIEPSDVIKEINESGIDTIKTDLNVDMRYDEADDIWKVEKITSQNGDFNPLGK